MLAVAGLACGLPGLGGPGREPPDPEAFSGSRAWAHLSALSELGPREPGSPGAEKARLYLREQLDEGGVAEVREVRFPLDDGSQGVHLVGVLPGRSNDVLMLAAAYDSPAFEGFRYQGANASASGPAVVLELGRALALRERPYTIWLVFVDADAVAPGGDPQLHDFPGSTQLAQTLDAQGDLERIRAAVFFDRVADPELVIARDLHSHGIYRDLFFEVAHERGYDAAFPRANNFRRPRTGHRAWLDHGFRRVIAIVDLAHGPGRPPGVYWHSPDDTPARSSERSLAIVGEVSLAAIVRIANRLEKVDLFAQPPSGPPR